MLLSIALFKYALDRKSFLGYTNHRRLLDWTQPPKIKWFQSCRVSIGFMSPEKPFFFYLVIARSKGKLTDSKVLNSIFRQPNLQNVSWWRQCTAHSVLLVKSFYFNSNKKFIKWFQWKAKKKNKNKTHNIQCHQFFWKENITATYPAIRWRFLFVFDIIDSILINVRLAIE